MKLPQGLARHAATLTLLAVLSLIGACSNKTPESLVKAGEALLAKSDPASAAIQFKAALQMQPDLASVRLLLGRTLLMSGDAVSAVVELEKAREQGQNNNDVAPALARALLATGDAKRLVTMFDGVTLGQPAAQASLKTSLASGWNLLGNRAKADAALAQALSASVDFGPAKVLQARQRADGGDVDGALSDLAQVLKADPSLVEGWFAKGEVLAYVKGDLAGGKAAFIQAQLLDKFFVPAYASLAGLAVRQHDLPAAASEAAALRKLLPTHPHAVFIDAMIDLQQGRLKEAREKSQGLLRIGGDNVGVLMLAGSAEGALGSYATAESYFTKALTIDPKIDAARRSLALTYLNLGHPGRALEALKPLTGAESADAASLAMAGEATLRLNDAKGAEALFLRSAKLDPSDPFVNTSLAVSQLKRGNVERAFADLSALSTRDSKDTVADMALISARMSRAEWPQALQALDSAVLKTPADASLLELRGRILIGQGDLAGARIAFAKALALDPKYFAATANLTAVDLLEKKPEAAAQRLRQAMKFDPRNIYAGLALADIRAKAGAPLSEQQQILAETIAGSPSDSLPRVKLVELNLVNKRAREAMQAAQDAVAALPTNAAVLEVLARAQATGGDVQQAISTYRRLASLDPKDVRPLQRLADLYRSAGDRKSAENIWRRIAEINPRFPGVQARIVELLMADKKPSEALNEALSLQQRTADSAVGYMLEAAVHQRAKAWDKAAEALRKGAALHPSNNELAIRLYNALLASGRKDEAAKLAERWPKDNPQDAEFEVELANSYLIHEDVPAAERVLRAVVARHAEHALALNNLAYVLAVQKKAGGVELAERALRQTAENSTMLDTYATALTVEGQVARALDVQRRAVSLSPDDPMLRLNLARMAIEAGDKILARTELDALAARGKDFSRRAEVERLQKLL